MEIEIVETPISFSLYGTSGIVTGCRYGEVGLKLMEEMWRIVKQAEIRTTGINHWVYLPADRLFVGVELQPEQAAPNDLALLQFTLPRYLKHKHIGPYDELPEKWKALTTELAARGEAVGPRSLEIYGHHCEGDDAAQAETTVLIGLQPHQ